MRIILCDDEDIFSEQLKDYLEIFFDNNKLEQPVIDIFDNGEMLLKDTGNKDIVFLDVEMPGLSGIHIGNELKKYNPDIIIFIVTSYSEYLDEAMRFHVFRYLTKPVDKQRLFRNMKDAIYQYTTVNAKITIETKDGVEVVKMSDIVCVEIINRRTIIHTNKKDYQSVNNMQYWLDHLDKACFFQSHKSFIVNMEYVTRFDTSMIYLAGGKLEAYLTRRRFKQFKNSYMLYLEGRR